MPYAKFYIFWNFIFKRNVRMYGFSQDTWKPPGRPGWDSKWYEWNSFGGGKPLLWLKEGTYPAPARQPPSSALRVRVFFQPLLLSLQLHAAGAMMKSSCMASPLNGVRGLETDDSRGFQSLQDTDLTCRIRSNGELVSISGQMERGVCSHWLCFL